MRLVRFLAQGRTAWGLVSGGGVAELEHAERVPLPPFRTQKTVHRLADLRLLAPCRPTKVVAVGLNYREHANELGLRVAEAPILFLKPPSAIIGPGEAISCPAASSRVDYEAELGVVIKDRTKNVRPGEALGHVLGYTCVNDVTARDLQKKDGQWTRAKSFDTFCPVGPWIETDVAPDDLLVESYLNGAQRQSSRTSQLLFGADRLISFISEVMTLEPGDLILTGTPPGIGPMKPGDEIEIRIGGIGSLKNTVSG
jgi:2-keto-4-pentenoate hydratase/2-oxohepta-3-ene-1,7-dioic acid hydratase in catechol pathway